MKKLFLFLFFSLFFLSLYSQKIEYVYHFDIPEIKKNGDYEMIILPNSQQFAKIGEPSLPYVPVKLLLPPSQTSKKISYIFENKIQIKGNYNLYPKQHSNPISIGSNGIFEINKNIYKETTYPKTKNNDVNTHFMNGYAIAMSSFTPFEYNPSTGEVFMYKNVKVIIEYQDNKDYSELNISSRPEVIEKVSSYVQNSDILKQYPKKKTSNSYDMLIITSDAFANSFTNLITFHLNRGIVAQVVTVTQITNTTNGVDAAEKIRNYIIQEYQNNDIQYVTLAGDIEIVPYRGFFCSVQSSSVYEDDNIPADVYFSALDGNWNTDGDANWGEPDEDDLLPEIAVGRLPFSNSTELSNIINKIINYSNSPVTTTDELINPLLAGEFLTDDPTTYGSDYLNLLIGYQNENGYITNGINTNYTTMYVDEGTWNGYGDEIMDAMNSGYGFLHHVGHANSDFMMGLSTSDITSANFAQLNGTTHNYALVYSHGCICGAFDANDCVSETMVKINKCAVAVFTNSRYGWFNQGQTEGPSQHLHREFVDALYFDKQNHAGIAEIISKNETAPWCEVQGEFEPGAQRWCFYDHNVLTDPALPIWTNNPQSFSVSYENVLPLGADYIVNVNTNKTPLENAKCFILQNNKIIGRAYTNISGIATINVDIQEATIGIAKLIVVGYNTLPQEYDINIIEATGAVLSMFSSTFSDDNNNIPDYNEQLFINLVIKNYGQQNATNVTLTLSSEDENVTIIEGEQIVGTINALGQFESTNILKIQTNYIPDQYSTLLTLEINSDQYTTTRQIPLTINAPELELLSVDIIEVTGNSNGIIEPGETGEISFNYKNIGHSTSPNINGILSTTNQNVTINTLAQNIGEINANTTFSIVSNFLLNNNINLGDFIDITCNANANIYSKAYLMNFFVGETNEDFETGNFEKFDWQFDGDENWTIENTGAYQGSYCSKSGLISDDEASSLIISANILQDGNIEFAQKVSSEFGWDFLKFYIDGTPNGVWSGSGSWTTEQIEVTAGNHTFKWEYSKDYNVTNGEDCAWLDNITFPPFGSLIVVTEVEPIITSNKDFKVFPVPFEKEVNFEFYLEKPEQVKIEIYDISGRIITNTKVNFDIGTNNYKWVSDNSTQGMLLYKVTIGNQMYFGKMIKKQ